MKNVFVYSSLFALFSFTAGNTFASDSAVSEDPHWHYEDQADWGAISAIDTTTLAPELYPYAECGLGAKQSPVDLGQSTKVTTTNLLRPSYRAETLSVSNNGHTIKVNTQNSTLNIGSEKYQLLQYHIHAPSEHVVDEKTYPLEIHFVHATPDGKLAVIGVFAEAGIKENADFQKILNNAPKSVEDVEIKAFTLNPAKLLSSTRDFYLYSGSLTTPPCTEGVNWYVLKNPIQLSQNQITAFEAFYSDNARHHQALNGRSVLLK